MTVCIHTLCTLRAIKASKELRRTGEIENEERSSAEQRSFPLSTHPLTYTHGDEKGKEKDIVQVGVAYPERASESERKRETIYRCPVAVRRVAPFAFPLCFLPSSSDCEAERFFFVLSIYFMANPRELSI